MGLEGLEPGVWGGNTLIKFTTMRMTTATTQSENEMEDRERPGWKGVSVVSVSVALAVSPAVN